MRKIILKNFLFPLLISAGFFCILIKASNAANFKEVIINEIAWMGTTSSANDEWLELKNTTDHDIDLNGWSLIAQDGAPLINLSCILSCIISSSGYFLLERTDDTSVPDIKADVIYTGALSNDGEFLGLRDQAQTLIDSVDAIKGWQAGDNMTKKTMEREDDGNWQTSQNVEGTPKAINSIISASSSRELIPSNTQEATSTSTPTSTPIAIAQTAYRLGDVLINEFVADPADNDVEWIEIYNTTNKEINLSNWTIEDGNKTKTNLSGLLGINSDNKFKVIEKLAGILNNSGDLIIIRDGLGNLIDQVAYGNWDDGDKNNNAPSVSNPFSVARKFDGYNTFNNANDFSITIKPTKGVSNIIQIEDEVSAEAKAKFDFSNDIFISEILPNPIGDDAKQEFIEIYNKGARDVNLTGWSLSNEDNKKINFEKIATNTTAAIAIIKAGEYLAFFRPQTKIVMHNDLEKIKLFQPLSDKPIQTVEYKNVEEGQSYNFNTKNNECENAKTRNNAECWEWSETTTFGSVNIIKTINHSPEVNFSFPNKIIANQPILFDSSDTFDQDNDELKFNWDFGNGIKLTLPFPEHTFLRPGAYTVSLIVDDGQNKIKKEKIIKVLSNSTALSPLLNKKDEYNPPLFSEGSDNGIIYDNIIINEIFPNPKGVDKNNEWLELKNQSLDKINLKNWQIENNNGKYKFKNDLWINGKDFYLLTDKESNLAFKNTADIISLYNDADELIDKVEYTKAVQDETYCRGVNNKWFWTTIATPEAENVISVAKSKAITEDQIIGEKNAKKNIIETTLEKVGEREIGDLLKVKGKVAVLPGIFGTQYFYIVGSPGLQIYNYKKEFPGMLKVGDYIEVVGELSEINNEARLKTKGLVDIKILEHQNPPIARVLSSNQSIEEYQGQLISITGEVTDKKGSTIYLDDGNSETEIYIKRATGIKSADIEKGNIYTITGIISETQSGLKLMPRSIDDIVIQNQTAKADKILGNVADSNEWQIANRDKKLELFKYLLIIATGAIILLIGLIIKFWRNKKYSS